MTKKQSTPIKEPRKAIDWESIEREYRVGIRSLQNIGDEFGCTEGAIRKKAKEHNWTRDLSAKVKARATELVRKEEVRNEVRIETATDRQVIEASATISALIQISHRKDIKRNRELSIKMLEELEATTDNKKLFAKLGLMLAAPDEKGSDKLNDIYMKVISMPSRVDSFKKLTETLKTLVALEREAYNIGLSATGLTPEQEALKGLFDHMAQNKPSLLPE